MTAAIALAGFPIGVGVGVGGGSGLLLALVSGPGSIPPEQPDTQAAEQRCSLEFPSSQHFPVTSSCLQKHYGMAAESAMRGVSRG